MSKDKKYVTNDTLNPAEIITQHIRKIMNAENVEQYSVDIDKLEDLLCTEIDDDYGEAEKEIDKKVEGFNVTPPAKLNRDTHDSFSSYKAVKKEHYRKRLLFRELVKLAKRRDLWLVDEESAIISHDKKKVTSTAKR